MKKKITVLDPFYKKHKKRFHFLRMLFYLSQKISFSFAWGHTAVKARHPVRSGKLSTAGLD